MLLLQGPEENQEKKSTRKKTKIEEKTNFSIFFLFLYIIRNSINFKYAMYIILLKLCIIMLFFIINIIMLCYAIIMLLLQGPEENQRSCHQATC